MTLELSLDENTLEVKLMLWKLRVFKGKLDLHPSRAKTFLEKRPPHKKRALTGKKRTKPENYLHLLGYAQLLRYIRFKSVRIPYRLLEEPDFFPVLTFFESQGVKVHVSDRFGVLLHIRTLRMALSFLIESIRLNLKSQNRT